MSDREEKVLKGLECCTESISKACPMECPYRVECMMQDDGLQMYSVMHDALKLLKEQSKQRFFVDSDGKITPLPIQPQWEKASKELPTDRGWYLGIFQEADTGWINPIPFICDYVGKLTHATTKEGWIIRHCTDREFDDSGGYYYNLKCVAWMPLPEPPEEVKQ